jgi:hypothetical protein
MARIPPPVLSRLPRTVSPFPGETTDSYLTRLSHANRLDTQALRCYFAGRRDRTPPSPQPSCGRPGRRATRGWPGPAQEPRTGR